MNKQDVIAFFDRLAPGWDADLIKNDGIIEKILDNAEVEAGMDVLDVACGTGVVQNFTDDYITFDHVCIPGGGAAVKKRDDIFFLHR